MREAALQHAVPGDLTQVTRAQLPHLSCNCIFFHKCFLRVVELHGVIGGERNMQPLVQKFPQRVFGIFEEQAVVAKRRHGNGDLSKVVEILQHRTLLEEQPMGNVVSSQECRHQVGDGAGLPTVRPEQERAQASFPAGE